MALSPLPPVRRVVTGHDSNGRSVVVADGTPPQHHTMSGPAVGADFIEVWSAAAAVPELTAVEASEPNERPFTIMPTSGHLIRILDVHPLAGGGSRSVMHRTSTLDYVVVIEGELTLLLDDGEVTLHPGSVVVQRGTDHAWENRGDTVARAAFFHLDATFADDLLSKLPAPLEILR